MIDRTLENHSLLKECVEALDIKLLPYEEELKIASLFNKMCPLRGWVSTNKDKFEKKSDLFKKIYPIILLGKVDWDRFDKKIYIGYDPEDIISALEQLLGKIFNTDVYIEWDTWIPILKTNLVDIIRNFDVVCCVSSYKFIFNPDEGYIVEILSSGEIVAGIFPTSDKFLKNDVFIDQEILKHDIVFRECVQVLHSNLLPEEEEKSADKWFRNNVPMTKWGRVDWDKFEKKIDVGYDYKTMKRTLSKFLHVKGPFDTTVYIEWGDVGIPVIKTDLGSIIGHFEDVACVSFEKFIFNPSLGYVIELLHSRQITIGIVPHVSSGKE